MLLAYKVERTYFEEHFNWKGNRSREHYAIAKFFGYNDEATKLGSERKVSAKCHDDQSAP